MKRVYRIEFHTAPREPEGTKVSWFGSANGVTRTVEYEGTTKVVTWTFPDDEDEKQDQ